MGKEMKTGNVLHVPGLMVAFSCLLLAGTTTGQMKLLLHNDFEKGLQKWERRGAGGVSIKSSKKDAANGKKSLWVTGREQFWQGAQLNVSEMLEAGKNYKFTVSAKLESGQQPAVLKMTIQRGDNRWEPIASATTTDAEWTTLSGGFRPDGGDPYLLVFVESEDPKSSYFLDGFKIEVPKAPAD
jgi:endo-1,4-beta-xylanase